MKKQLFGLLISSLISTSVFAGFGLGSISVEPKMSITCEKVDAELIVTKDEAEQFAKDIKSGKLDKNSAICTKNDGALAVCVAAIKDFKLCSVRPAL